MHEFKARIHLAISRAVATLGVEGVEIVIHDVPEGQLGNYGSPVAFQLAKALRRSPSQVAIDLLAVIEVPEGFVKVQAVGPYLNFTVDAGSFIASVVNE